MLASVYSAGLEGVDGYIVTVECNMEPRLAAFEIVGLPDAAVKEAKERIRAAICNSGFEFPDAEITINLAPADKKKQGSAYDLALLACVLSCSGMLPDTLEGKCFIGELSLSGEVRPVRGVLSMCDAARAAGLSEVFVPARNAAEASVVQGITVYPVPDVAALVSHLRGEKPITAAKFDESSFDPGAACSQLDFADVKGQEFAKRALLIAAAGGHNVLMIGPPGTGKSMLAKRIPSILPDFTLEEAIETTKIHSVAGLLPENVALITHRPFRSPHHTMSPVSLAGGGSVPLPGEVSLAHNGVLFLDELPEYIKTVAEVLRQPLEDRHITITRASGRYTFPCNFMLVCAMNPCRCGYFGHPSKNCTCKPADIRAYLSKVSGPLLDRIDIQIEVSPLSFDELSKLAPSRSSADMRTDVNKARAFALKRFLRDGKKLRCNTELSPADLRKYCTLDDEATAIMRAAFENMGLSARGYDRILRVARTIADLEESENIKAHHIAEAVQLRSLDRKYWQR